MKIDSTMEDVIAAARVQAGRRGPVHSPLYEWLWRHHDRLAPEFDPPRTPNWREVAQTLAARGIMAGPAPRGGDPAPRPPTAELVRRTWAKVVRDKARQAAGDGGRGRRGVQLSVAVPAQAGEALTASPSVDRVEPRREILPLAPDEDDEFPLTFVRPRTYREGES